MGILDKLKGKPNASVTEMRQERKERAREQFNLEVGPVLKAEIGNMHLEHGGTASTFRADRQFR